MTLTHITLLVYSSVFSNSSQIRSQFWGTVAPQVNPLFQSSSSFPDWASLLSALFFSLWEPIFPSRHARYFYVSFSVYIYVFFFFSFFLVRLIWLLEKLLGFCSCIAYISMGFWLFICFFMGCPLIDVWIDSLHGSTSISIYDSMIQMGRCLAGNLFVLLLCRLRR